MGDSGAYGRTPDPGSAREEAERLVATAIAMARSAASEARNRAGALGPLGEMISDVLDQTGMVPRPTRPEPTRSEPVRPEPTPARSEPVRPEPTPARSEPVRPEPTPARSEPVRPEPTRPDPSWTDNTAAPTDEAPPEQARTAAPPEGDPATNGSATSEDASPGTGAATGADAPVGAGFATGDPECCVCPVCRSIAALRDPSPELAERLATGAGDFAAGVASLLRALSSVARPATGRTGTTRTAADDRTGDSSADATSARKGPFLSFSVVEGPPPYTSPGSTDDTLWREATGTRHDSWPADEPDDVWAAATRAEAGTRETGTGAGPDRATPAGAEPARPAAQPATGRPPVPGSRTPEGPVGTGSGEPAAPGEDG